MDFQRWWADEGHRLWRDEKLLASEVARAAWEDATKVEREACAKVCEERYPENYGGVITEHPCYASSNECAEAIRARGNE